MELFIQYALQVLEGYPSSFQRRTVTRMRHEQVLQPEHVKGLHYRQRQAQSTVHSRKVNV